MNALFYPLFIHAKKFYVTDACVSCGKCAEVCPLQISGWRAGSLSGEKTVPTAWRVSAAARKLPSNTGNTAEACLVIPSRQWRKMRRMGKKPRIRDFKARDSTSRNFRIRRKEVSKEMKNENLKDKNIKNGKLAVVFPGVGYHADKPLLYYSRKLAAQYGYEIICADYGILPSGIKGDAGKSTRHLSRLFLMWRNSLPV